jgi:hypothetical protein
MRRTGIWLIVFGVLNFALPRLGYDLTWFEYLGRARSPIAAGLIVAGAALVGVDWKKRRISP